MIYFTSDLHLGHRAAISMCQRPFASVEEMNDVIINNINTKVGIDDTLYILGDIIHHTPVQQANEIISQIKCKNKILIKGNHDKKYDNSLFLDVRDFFEANFSGVNISMMHYPMVEWPKSFHGSIHLHGHQHNGPEYNIKMREEGILRYDVGVDANNFFPVSLAEILDFFYIPHN